MTGHSARRGPRKQLIRESDGMLHDLTMDRPITPLELRDFVSSGGYFEARRHDGMECTAQVLVEALRESISEQLQPRTWGAMGAMLGAAAPDPLVRLLGQWGAWGSTPGYQSRWQRAARAERPSVPPRPPRRGPRASDGLVAMDDQESA